MHVDVAEQARVLLQSILLGAGLGLVYDVLRALRRSLGWRWLAFLLDLLFWLGTIALLFFMALTRETGQLRLYLPAAFLLGGGVYLLTLSRLVLPLLLKILAALGKFWRWSTEPARKGGRLAKKVWKKRKKDFQNWWSWYRITMDSYHSELCTKGASRDESEARRRGNKNTGARPAGGSGDGPAVGPAPLAARLLYRARVHR